MRERWQRPGRRKSISMTFCMSGKLWHIWGFFLAFEPFLFSWSFLFPICRPMNCPPWLELRSCYWLPVRPVTCTPLPPGNCNPWSQVTVEKLWFKLVWTPLITLPWALDSPMMTKEWIPLGLKNPNWPMDPCLKRMSHPLSRWKYDWLNHLSHNYIMTIKATIGAPVLTSHVYTVLLWFK